VSTIRALAAKDALPGRVRGLTDRVLFREDVILAHIDKLSKSGDKKRPADGVRTEEV